MGQFKAEAVPMVIETGKPTAEWPVILGPTTGRWQLGQPLSPGAPGSRAHGHEPERDLGELSGASLPGWEVVGHHLDLVAGLTQVQPISFGEAPAAAAPYHEGRPHQVSQGRNLQ
jgi:hypothetical protein